MSFNMNSGYHGWSMSNRAYDAYDNGEMPKSKWTKKAMLEALKESCDLYDLMWNEAVEKMKKDEIFNVFFEYKGWHHTGKYCNVTNFYGVDDNALDEYFMRKRK